MRFRKKIRRRKSKRLYKRTVRPNKMNKKKSGLRRGGIRL